MQIIESEFFIKQIYKLSKSKSYSKINEDIESLKEEFPRIAFHNNLGTLNKPLLELLIPVAPDNCRKIIWRVKFSNSNNNKGKSGGYRLFYCSGSDDDIAIFLGVLPRQVIREGTYNEVVKMLVETLVGIDWS